MQPFAANNPPAPLATAVVDQANNVLDVLATATTFTTLAAIRTAAAALRTEAQGQSRAGSLRTLYNALQSALDDAQTPNRADANRARNHAQEIARRFTAEGI